MVVFEYGNPSASVVLIQMVDDHNLVSLKKEFIYISQHFTTFFALCNKKTYN